jgi:hypothetical protein
MEDICEKFFYNDFIDTSSDDSTKDDNDILINAALLLHEQQNTLPKFGGVDKGTWYYQSQHGRWSC